MKVFIDCGAFKGRTLEKYPYPEYKRYAFECNPLLKDFQYPEDVTVIRKAVWCRNGWIQFFINPYDLETEGCSIYSDKVTGNLCNDPSVYYTLLNMQTVPRVNCIDFGEWIGDNLHYSDHNILKMNIEGAEYNVLYGCIFNRSIDKINELHIYWHYKKVPSITEESHNNLLKQLQDIFGDKLHSYY